MSAEVSPPLSQSPPVPGSAQLSGSAELAELVAASSSPVPGGLLFWGPGDRQITSRVGEGVGS